MMKIVLKPCPERKKRRALVAEAEKIAAEIKVTNVWVKQPSENGNGRVRRSIAEVVPTGDAERSVLSGPLRGPDSQSSSSTTAHDGDQIVEVDLQRQPPLFTRLSELNEQRVEWFWKWWIPLGEITIVDGDPGSNKSSFLLDLAGRVSTGRSMPDGTASVHGGVLLLAGEDSLRKTIIGRLKAAGANMRRIAVMKGDVSLPDSLTDIQAAAVQLTAKLIIIDPFMAFVQPDANKEQAIRRVMTQLKSVAERSNIAIVLVRHLNKSGGRQSLYRGGGSIGIIAATRSALLVAKSPDDPHMRVLCHHKSNLGPLAPSLLFEPVTVEENVVGIEWRGPSDFTGEDLLSPKSGGGAALDKAKTFLLEMLRDGPVEQDVIENECKKQPFSYRTAERAKQALGIRSSRKQFGGVVFWELPRDKEQGDGSDSPHIDRQPDLAVYGGREGDAT